MTTALTHDPSGYLGLIAQLVEGRRPAPAWAQAYNDHFLGDPRPEIPDAEFDAINELFFAVEEFQPDGGGQVDEPALRAAAADAAAALRALLA